MMKPPIMERELMEDHGACMQWFFFLEEAEAVAVRLSQCFPSNVKPGRASFASN